MSQEHVELARQAYDALNRRDLGAFLALMDADVEALPRVVAIEGGYHGHDESDAGGSAWSIFCRPRHRDRRSARPRRPDARGRAHSRGTAQVATRRSPRRSGVPPSGVTGSASRGPTGLKPKPAKRWGCGSSCQSRTPAALAGRRRFGAVRCGGEGETEEEGVAGSDDRRGIAGISLGGIIVIVGIVLISSGAFGSG